MSEIHYVERVPRRPDFCGCPPCSLCYEPVITDDQQAPTFEEVMKQIYGEGPVPQTEQEYEWAHAAAHQTRQELEAYDGTYFHEQDRAHMTAVQVDDLLKRAKKAADAPKPLNRVNLDDMPVAVIEAATKTPVDLFAEAQRQYQLKEAQRAYQRAQNARMLQSIDKQMQEIVNKSAFKPPVILPVTETKIANYALLGIDFSKGP